MPGPFLSILRPISYTKYHVFLCIASDTFALRTAHIRTSEVQLDLLHPFDQSLLPLGKGFSLPHHKVDTRKLLVPW